MPSWPVLVTAILALRASSAPAASASSVALPLALTLPAPSRTRSPERAVIVALAEAFAAATVKSCTLPAAPAMSRLEPPMSSMARRLPFRLKAAAFAMSPAGKALPAFTDRRAAWPIASIVLPASWVMPARAPPVVAMPIVALPVWMPPALPSAVAAAVSLPAIRIASRLFRTMSAPPSSALLCRVLPAAWVRPPFMARLAMLALRSAAAVWSAFRARLPFAAATSMPA